MIRGNSLSLHSIEKTLWTMILTEMFQSRLHHSNRLGCSSQISRKWMFNRASKASLLYVPHKAKIKDRRTTLEDNQTSMRHPNLRRSIRSKIQTWSTTQSLSNTTTPSTSTMPNLNLTNKKANKNLNFLMWRKVRWPKQMGRNLFLERDPRLITKPIWLK